MSAGLPIQGGKFFYMDYTEDSDGYFSTKVIIGEGEAQQESFDMVLSADQFQIGVVSD